MNGPVYIVGAAALSAFGCGWRGLGQALLQQQSGFAPARQLAQSHGAVLASEVPALPPAMDVEARARKLMAYPARLAAIALHQALLDAKWLDDAAESTGFDDIAMFLGVGASGAAMSELNAMLAASISAHQFCLQRFGSAGLAACNPLFAFQLMNNFTLCHGAILQGIGGANSAFYSRGTGTVAALAEAQYVLASGSAERALAGGADSALHPVSYDQLLREGYVSQGWVPGEGAALLALSLHAGQALAQLGRVEFFSEQAWLAGADGSNGSAGLAGENACLAQIRQSWLTTLTPSDIVLIAPWGEPARQQLLTLCQLPAAPVCGFLDISCGLGDALAASPALAWAAALDLLDWPDCTGQMRYRRALVLSCGIDGGLGLVEIWRVGEAQ
jgi:Beta-ketoacyl synthase, N-terminal domain